MRKIILSFLVLTFNICFLGAQNVEHLVKEKMAPLYRLAGEWRGEGMSVLRDGTKAPAHVVEKAEVRLGGTLLVVEGVGVRPEAPADTVHFAYGVITYNPFTKQYNVRAYKSEGIYTDAVAAFLDDGSFEWRMENQHVGIIKNTLTLTGDEWVEVGEQSRDNGQTWTKFFEMRLRRVR
jgi:hypothetical protein